MTEKLPKQNQPDLNEPEKLLTALAHALAGEGPAVKLSPTGNSLIEAPEGVAVVVGTSGSTGSPKQAMLSVDSLAASSMGTAVHLRGEGQWLLALPTHYVAGAQVLIRSLFAGTAPEVLRGKFSVENFCSAAANLTDPFRITSLVPTQLQRLMADPQAHRVLQRFNAILLGGAPATPELLARGDSLGLNLVTTYGSAETCGGCIYDGMPLEGARFAILPDADGTPRVYLGGATIADGYLNDPERTAEAFTEFEGSRWYRTDDLGSVDDAGRLRLAGRADDVLITGGLKASAHTVAERLRGLDGIADAFVAGVPDERWGQLVSAAVVLAPGLVTDRNSDALHNLAASVLAPHEVPKAFLVLPELPLLANGKTDRQTLKALLNEHVQSTR